MIYYYINIKIVYVTTYTKVDNVIILQHFVVRQYLHMYARYFYFTGTTQYGILLAMYLP
jgi:hypothetical protein